MNKATSAVWAELSNHFQTLASERAGEGTGVQLACLVIAEHCVYEWSSDRGGPTPEMLTLAEKTTGVDLSAMFTKALAKWTVHE